ncbi:MAG: hypothetical protein WDZ32_01035, partial [Candidatus Saccharimonadales bacterium]
MNIRNILNYISYVPKSFTAIAAALVVTVMPIATMAGFGPDRPTFSINDPADYVTFNSITDNPNYGDERNFFDGKPASDTSTGGFSDPIEIGDLDDGDELLLRVYVHNNAKESLNDSGEGIAKNTHVRVDLPNNTDRSLRATASISADNANPGTVYDTLDFTSANRPFNLDYVADSAVIHTNAMPNGMNLSDDIITSNGAKIGYDKLNGEVPGCFEFTGIVTLKVKVNKADVEVDKFVRKLGETEWKTENNAKPGDTLEYLIRMKNSGSTTLKDVMVGDNLPKYTSYVEGTTMLKNMNNPNGISIDNDNITKGGINIGHYEPGSVAYVWFQAKVDPVGVFDKCGDYTIRNVGVVRPEDMNEFFNTADTNVTIKCEVTPTGAPPEDVPEDVP